MEKANEKKDFLQKTWVVCALALVCTFLWGSASPCIKLGYALFKIPSSETWTQVLFAGTRFVLAGVLTILIGSILNRKMLLPTESSVPNIVKLAMFQTILQYIFFYIGLAHNSGVKASIINGSNTFFVILVSTIIFRQEKTCNKIQQIIFSKLYCFNRFILLFLNIHPYHIVILANYFRPSPCFSSSFCDFLPFSIYVCCIFNAIYSTTLSIL